MFRCWWDNLVRNGGMMHRGKNKELLGQYPWGGKVGEIIGTSGATSFQNKQRCKEVKERARKQYMIAVLVGRHMACGLLEIPFWICHSQWTKGLLLRMRTGKQSREGGRVLLGEWGREGGKWGWIDSSMAQPLNPLEVYDHKFELSQDSGLCVFL